MLGLTHGRRRRQRTDEPLPEPPNGPRRTACGLGSHRRRPQRMLWPQAPATAPAAAAPATSRLGVGLRQGWDEGECYTCPTPALHIPYICPTTALQLPYNCPTTVLHLPYTCHTPAPHLPYTCPTPATQMPYNSHTTPPHLPYTWPATTPPIQLPYTCATNALRAFSGAPGSSRVAAPASSDAPAGSGFGCGGKNGSSSSSGETSTSFYIYWCNVIQVRAITESLRKQKCAVAQP